MFKLSIAAIFAGAAFFSQAVASPLGTTERVSVDSDGNEGNGFSGSPSVSANGRYVAFSSPASNLVDGDTNGAVDIFVHDRDTGTTELVSVDSEGNQGNGPSRQPSISADGRYVAFWSSASNLVDGDTNGSDDSFVHDRDTGTTERVSVDSDGNQGNSPSRRASISADGRYVVFESFASNLVDGDTNATWDIFVHDRDTGTTERVSVDSDGNQGNGLSGSPSISADGRYVAFHSRASNLVDGDTNGVTEVFVHDRDTGTTERVSVDSDGNEGNGFSSLPSISADGRHVAFHSRASNLVDGGTNGTIHVFVHDRATGTTELVSADSDGNEGNNLSQIPSISADGRHVAFWSVASNLVDGDTNGMSDIFAHDRNTGTTERVSVDSDGNEGNGLSDSTSISADGRHVAFGDRSSNLVDGDTNDTGDIFVHTRPFADTEATCTPLIAGGGNNPTNIGEVCVDVDGSALTVTYTTSNGWTLLRSHLHLADSVAGVPQTRRGNPKPGQFDHFAVYGVNTTQATFILPLDNLPAGDLVVAAHADVVLDGEEPREEGAWGDGERFTERGNWATHFTYTP